MPESSQLTAEQRQALEEKIKNMSPEQLKGLQRTQCIFCQIISGKIPAKKVHEDDTCIAVLDINPAAKGHLLLLPKEHFTILPQMPDPIVAHLMEVVKQLSQMLLKVFKVEGTNIFVANGPVAGQRAQHVMMHIIPRKEGDKILELQEKVLDKELQQKVKLALDSHLKQILGLAEAPKPPLLEKEPLAKEETAEVPKVKEKSSRKKKEKAATPKKEEQEKSSLDDIANLFK